MVKQHKAPDKSTSRPQENGKHEHQEKGLDVRFEPDESRRGRPLHPLDAAGFINRLFFGWMFRYLWSGYKKSLSMDDMPLVPTKSERCERVSSKLERNWLIELRRLEDGHKPSLLRAVVKTNLKWSIYNSAITFFAEVIFKTGIAYSVGQMLHYINNTDRISAENLWSINDPLVQWTLGLILNTCCWTMTAHYYGFEMMRMGLHTRASCSHLIYKKSLHLSQAALGKTTIGQMVNLLSNDIDKFNYVFIMLPFVWVGPLQTALSLYILWPILGPSCIGSLLLLCIMIPFQMWISGKFGRMRANIARLSDTRIRLVNEIISVLRIVKSYAWELAYIDIMGLARSKEVRAINCSMQLKGANMGIMFASGKLFLFVTIIFHCLVFHGRLDARILFMSLAVLNNVQMTMTRLLPLAVSMGAEAAVSVKRIEEFLLMEDRQMSPCLRLLPRGSKGKSKKRDTNNKSQQITENEKNKDKEIVVELNHMSAAWITDSPHLTLDDITLELAHNELMIVCGPVASGKSSLGLALLNELPIRSGLATVCGTIGYASQQSWIFAGTVKQNIIFNESFDSQRYERVIQVCALQRDLTLLEYGDATYINDKGTSLSGGQKARINLARCLYRQCDVYILDDPLSAVDAHVANHIFDNAICDFLRDKCVILSTHQLQFLRRSDKLLVLDQGKCAAFGTYAQLTRGGSKLTAEYLERARSHQQSFEQLEANKIDGHELNSVPTTTTEQSNQTSSENNLIVRDEPPPTYTAPIGGPSNVTSATKTTTAPTNDDELNKQPHELHTPTSTLTHKAKARFLKEVSKVGSFDTDTQQIRDSFSSCGVSAITGGVPPVSSCMNQNELNTPDTTEAITTKSHHQSNEPEDEGMGREFASARVWIDYHTIGSTCDIVFVVVGFLLTQLIYSIIDVYLTVWTLAEQNRPQSTNQQSNLIDSSLLTTPSAAIIGATDFATDQSALNQTNYGSNQLFVDNQQSTPTVSAIYMPLYSLVSQLSTSDHAIVYSAMIALLVFVCIIKNYVFFAISNRASELLFRRMFHSALFARISFFDTSPIGRFLTRATRDIGLLDELIPVSAYQVYETLLQWMATIVMTGAIDVRLIIPTVIIVLIFCAVHQIYVEPARDIQRLEGIARSPIFSHLSTSLLGLSTIRATKVEPKFDQMFVEYQDKHSSVFLLHLGCNRWLAVTLDWVNLIYISIVSIWAVVANLSGPTAGLITTNAIMLCGMIQHGMMKFAELEAQLTSIERVNEYCQLPQEDDYETDKNKQVIPRDWPQNGQVQFQSVDLYYNRVEKPVLKNINFTFEGGEKIGVVGRTGAGKSSIITTLFRLYDFDGNIVIDGLDTKQIGLRDLRSSIGIIPQEPALFTDTVRRNIDPFNQYEDEHIWRSLEHAHLKDAVKCMTDGLDSYLAEGGANLSSGQRQLVCLARALLRGNKIIVMDEATANVDPATDEIIQATVRTQFVKSTVIIIAHRLNTIMDCDRVLVMDAGRVVEFDHPYLLLSDPNGTFTSMVQSTGPSNAEKLFAVAKATYELGNGWS